MPGHFNNNSYNNNNNGNDIFLLGHSHIERFSEWPCGKCYKKRKSYTMLHKYDMNKILHYYYYIIKLRHTFKFLFKIKRVSVSCIS